MIKPTGIFNSFPRKRPDEVIRGNIKKKEAGRAITMRLNKEQIDRIESDCEDLGIPTNRYLSFVMDHYWHCKRP
jgi:predicted DNA binding CopG/RHH family protein